MIFLDDLLAQNEVFAASRFSPDWKIIPSRKLMIIGCVDPRVDPADVLGLKADEAAVIRNVGGRVTPSTLETLTMLDVVAKAGGGALGTGWNLVILHHTDCGITRLARSPDLLAAYFGVSPADLGALAIEDPRASVAVDVAALKANPRLPGGFVVTGLLYDVASGRAETVVAPALLRP